MPSEKLLNSQQRAEAVALTALRIVVGAIFVVHGAMKLMDVPGTAQGFAALGIPYPAYAVYLAIAGELGGGLGLMLGLLTRVAALGALCSMAVAIGYAHLGHGLLAKNGGWEYPLVLGLIALYFVTRGGGPASVDARFARRQELPSWRTVRTTSHA
ncbi:MAG TPA: DoxX family protein [Polyangiaceae bacterium]